MPLDRLGASLVAALAVGGLVGCANPLADYEALTAKTAADLEAKTQQYVRDTAVLDSVRRSQEATQERRLLTDAAATNIRLNAMGLTGDNRPVLVAKLRAASDAYLAARLQAPTPAVALTTQAAPPMTDVVAALDKLSAPTSTEDNAKELYGYFKEVRDDLKADQAAKAAEAAVSAAGAAKK